MRAPHPLELAGLGVIVCAVALLLLHTEPDPVVELILVPAHPGEADPDGVPLGADATPSPSPTE